MDRDPTCGGRGVDQLGRGRLAPQLVPGTCRRLCSDRDGYSGHQPDSERATAGRIGQRHLRFELSDEFTDRLHRWSRVATGLILAVRKLSTRFELGPAPSGQPRRLREG